MTLAETYVRTGAELVGHDVASTSPLSIDEVTVVELDGALQLTLRLGPNELTWPIDPDSVASAAVEIADQLQYEIEAMLRAPWPACSEKPRHSLRPAVRDGHAIWVCDDHSVTTPIGSLASDLVEPRDDSHVIRGLDLLPLDERVSLARDVLRRLEGLMATAYVDGFTDVRALPRPAADALTKIKERAPLVRRLLARPRHTYMAVPLSVRDPEEFELVISFAPYSIHTEVIGHDDTAVLVLHDASTAIEVWADASTMAAIAHDLPPGLVLEP